MPQQLIYTSAPRGVVAGRSGYCTVARSAAMREALMLQLERFSYYQHLSLSGGKERPIFSCRVVDIRGARYHVLSRIQDAGLDFTGRTNFIAHHLVFAPDELQHNASPPAVLREWPGWARGWTKDPELLENEDWSGLAPLAAKSNVPAQTWQRLTGDAINGYGLLEARAGASFQVDGLAEDDVLQLFAESLELLAVRGPHRESRLSAWNYTFTTSMQEQDNPADFRWRCIHSDNPAAARFAPPDCRPLSAVRVLNCTAEETAFARTGRQSPRIVAEPANLKIGEGESARFAARAEGVPRPAYQWFSVDRNNQATILPGETNPELVVSNPVLGISRYRVSASNSSGAVQSEVAVLQVEPGPKNPLRGRPAAAAPAPAKPVVYSVKSEQDIERDRRRHQQKHELEDAQRRQRQNKIWMMTVMAIGVLLAGAFAFRQTLLSSRGGRPTMTNDNPNAREATNAVPQVMAKPPAAARTNPAPPPAPTTFSTANLATTNNAHHQTYAGGPLPTNPATQK